MTQLERAFDEALKLPTSEQDAFAAWMLDELASEQRWAQAFANSQDVLAELADAALTEHREGKTRRLNVDEL